MRLTNADYLSIQARLDRGKERLSTKVDNGCERERDLHEQTVQELRNRRVYFVHSRMDKPATNGAGTPDFIVAMPNGKTLWLELKTATGKLSEEQQVAKHMLENSGHEHHVVRSYKQLLEVIK